VPRSGFVYLPRSGLGGPFCKVAGGKRPFFRGRFFSFYPVLSPRNKALSASLRPSKEQFPFFDLLGRLRFFRSVIFFLVLPFFLRAELFFYRLESRQHFSEFRRVKSLFPFPFLGPLRTSPSESPFPFCPRKMEGDGRDGFRPLQSGRFCLSFVLSALMPFH